MKYLSGDQTHIATKGVEISQKRGDVSQLQPRKPRLAFSNSSAYFLLVSLFFVYSTFRFQFLAAIKVYDIGYNIRIIYSLVEVVNLMV